MSAEIPAKQARELSNNKDYWNTEKWYRVWKDNFFEELKKEALKGNNQMIINSDEWESSNHNQRYLVKKLESLGYSVVISQINNEETMAISW